MLSTVGTLAGHQTVSLFPPLPELPRCRSHLASPTTNQRLLLRSSDTLTPLAVAGRREGRQASPRVPPPCTAGWPTRPSAGGFVGRLADGQAQGSGRTRAERRPGNKSKEVQATAEVFSPYFKRSDLFFIPCAGESGATVPTVARSSYSRQQCSGGAKGGRCLFVVNCLGYSGG